MAQAVPSALEPVPPIADAGDKSTTSLGEGAGSPLAASKSAVDASAHIRAAKHAKLSKEKIEADQYMATHTVPQLLEWFTVELLEHQPTQPLTFLKDLILNTAPDGYDTDHINGLSLLRASYEKGNQFYREQAENK